MYEQPQTNTDGYNCFADVLNEIRDVYVDDIVRYTTRISQEHLQYIKPAPRGVYVRGMLEPIINFDSASKRYYTESQYRTNKARPNILNYQEFVNSKEAIVDERGMIICGIPTMVRSYFKDTCDYHYSAIHSAMADVWHLLESLSTKTNVCCQIPRNHLDTNFWINDNAPEGFKIGSIDYQALIDSVYNFVKKDYLSLYTLRLKNTTLFVEKGNDFRVVEYYKGIFEKIENERFEQYGF